MQRTLKIHYDSIEGLKAFAAIGIVIMHVRANNSYEIRGFLYDNIISFFTNLVFLFMIISAFGLCCGYYEKLSKNQFSIATFYEKRYQKIWPYFALLVLLDFVMSPSLSSLIEAFADLTLAFGLLPNANITVIGVGWFLGVIFLFYMLFPFFCFWLKTKKRAWLVFVICLIYNITCVNYFFDDNHVVDGFSARTNFTFCAMFFMAGGLIYLYKERLEKFIGVKYKHICLVFCWIVSVGYFLRPEALQCEEISNIWMLIMFSMWVIYAICSDGIILNNKVTKFLSGISMEIYLCHMMIFRVVEKFRLNYLFGYGWRSYIVVVVLVLVGAISFSLCTKWLLIACRKMLVNKK